MRFVRTHPRATVVAVSAALAAGSIAALTGAAALPMGLDHSITCTYTPDRPYQYGSGAPVKAEVDIDCVPEGPDVSSTTIRIWRLDSKNNKYYLVAERTSNTTGANWTLGVTGACTAKVGYMMHTQVINDSFHGTWGHTMKNSSAVKLYC